MPSRIPLSKGEKLEIFPPPREFGEGWEGSFIDFCKRSNIRQKVPPVEEGGNSHLS
jgi:hypothetical protein